jgi:RHS repeat-associated protein
VTLGAVEPFPLQPLLPAVGFGRMILFVPSPLAKDRGSRHARSFTASRKTADPRTEKRSLLVNLDKQPTVIHRPDGSTSNFTYDSAGRLSAVTYPKGPEVSDGTITITRTYNPTTGKLSSVSTSDGQTITYGYDGSLLLSTTWSGAVAGSVSRTYNNDFRVASESVNSVNSVAFGYDNDGLLTSADGLSITRDPTNGLVTDTTMGQVTDHRTYDSFGMLATYEAKFGTTSLYSVAYVRDSLERVQQKTETIQGTPTVWNYSYDSAGRLWQVMQNGVLSATYLYDANGNRQSKTTSSGSETATYDDQDRLLAYGKWSYTYTPNGELRTKTDTTNGQLTTYTYDGAGNLRKVVLPDGRVIDYIIDGRGRRIAKKVNGTLVRKWVYRGDLVPAAEFDGNGALLSRYAGAAVVKAGTNYRLVADPKGSPRLLVDAAVGTVVDRMEHDEWGQVLADSSPGFQIFGYAGGIYDADTGLVRFGARDYDPVVGRWTAKDSARFGGGSASLYTYAGGDPINFIDPRGQMKLPDSPSGLGPEWTRDCSHRPPNGERWRHPSGDYLDFDRAQPGKPGHRGRDHWHRNSEDPHLYPGDEIPDPAPACKEEPKSSPDPDPDTGADDPDEGPLECTGDNSNPTFEGTGPWNEDGTPVNPSSPGTPILPGPYGGGILWPVGGGVLVYP